MKHRPTGEMESLPTPFLTIAKFQMYRLGIQSFTAYTIWNRNACPGIFWFGIWSVSRNGVSSTRQNTAEQEAFTCKTNKLVRDNKKQPQTTMWKPIKNNNTLILPLILHNTFDSMLCGFILTRHQTPTSVGPVEWLNDSTAGRTIDCRPPLCAVVCLNRWFDVMNAVMTVSNTSGCIVL